jgi:hypothetical protein
MSPRCMISGTLSLTKEEFDACYKPEIDAFITQYSEGSFIMGDAVGADTLALQYLLKEVNLNPGLITVCHRGSTHDKAEYFRDIGVKLVGGFASYNERDCNMTSNSDMDIAFIKGDLYSLGGGTMKNLMRREYGKDVSNMFTNFMRGVDACSFEKLGRTKVLQDFTDNHQFVSIEDLNELIKELTIHAMLHQ